MKFLIFAGLIAALIPALAAEETPTPLPPVFVVPNFHPASCGWLANFSVERSYCANSYLNHLDRVRDDANYEFALSECNNMIAIRNFAPERFAELKQRLKEGRVDAVNAFFLEPTINLSGGEALAKMGIEGLRWQGQVMGVRPKYCWAIDTCGSHDQMAQICKLLNLDGYVYTRCRMVDQSVFWSESPDGSKMLTLVPGPYSDFSMVMGAKEALTDDQLQKVEKTILDKARHVAPGMPVLFLGGAGDYSLAPRWKENPTAFLNQWKAYRPDVPIRFSTLSQYVTSFQPDKLNLKVVRSGTRYSPEWTAFWIEAPRVKTWYRRDEHALQAAETIATIASLEAGYSYPVQDFYHSWLQMLLNMDRNTLWGAAGGMVFESEKSWDAKDRFEWVEKQTATASSSALHQLAGTGQQSALFNPLNWNRSDIPLPACGLGQVPKPLKPAVTIPLPTRIETPFYSAHIDPNTGALDSLKLKPSGREMLGGPANVLVLEKNSARSPGDAVPDRPKRTLLDRSLQHKPRISVTEDSSAIVVETWSDFLSAHSVIRFNQLYPRIEFKTEVTDIPDLSVLFAEFPLAEKPAECRRGIPFGFSLDAKFMSGIQPVIRWSDYATPGKGGVSLLDRGLTGREINNNIPILYLYNATDKYWGYFNPWLSGKGPHEFEYALYAHDADWATARVPQQAWEYNCPPIRVDGCKQPETKSFVTTSKNLIAEVMRRDGNDIELRLVECVGVAGNAEVTVNLPHRSAALTDLVGGHAVPLSGGATYRFPVKPQQIITIRLKTGQPVAAIEPLTEWDSLVPPNKLGALHEYLKNKMGHPPHGSN